MKILFFIDKMHPKQANSKKKLFFWVTTFLDEIFHDGKLTLLEQCTISDKVLTLKGLFVYLHFGIFKLKFLRNVLLFLDNPSATAPICPMPILDLWKVVYLFAGTEWV